MDLVAMLIKDLKMIVSEDKVNIRNLVIHMKWGNIMAENLIKANGLRNIIVHQYNGIQKDTISSSIFIFKKDLNDWLQHIEECIEKIEAY